LAFALPTGAELIELLHRSQRQNGWLTPAQLQQLADQLALPPSRVWGVASFYNWFALKPPPRHRCEVCLGTACFVRGGAQLLSALQQHLAGSDWAVQPVGCQGACGQGPLLRLDGELGDGAAWLQSKGVV